MFQGFRGIGKARNQLVYRTINAYANTYLDISIFVLLYQLVIVVFRYASILIISNVLQFLDRQYSLIIEIDFITLVTIIRIQYEESSAQVREVDRLERISYRYLQSGLVQPQFELIYEGRRRLYIVLFSGRIVLYLYKKRTFIADVVNLIPITLQRQLSSPSVCTDVVAVLSQASTIPRLVASTRIGLYTRQVRSGGSRRTFLALRTLLKLWHRSSRNDRDKGRVY